MSRLNRPKVNTEVTHEGGRAAIIDAEKQLRRSLMACLLWEKTFYEDGVSIADRIKTLVPHVKPAAVSLMAIEARRRMNLRHAPLLLVREMARHKEFAPLVKATLVEVIQRADELAEFLAIYWMEKKQPLTAQVKKGLAAAFQKFDEYQLAKYNRDNAVKLRDVLFLCHAKPKDQEQAQLWTKLVGGALAVPDTWEVALSAGADKKATWERLIKEGKLGGFAFLRNLRNMVQAGIDRAVLNEGFSKMRTDRILPFRFVAAAQVVPQLEPQIEQVMMQNLQGAPKLPGHTVLLVDVSGSMDAPLSKKSEMKRTDASAGLAIVLREICESVDVFTFSDDLKMIAPRHGFALRDAVLNSQAHNGTYLGRAIQALNQSWATHKLDPGVHPDRLIVLTDEQTHDKVGDPPIKNAYMINVAPYKNGVGYGAWTHIDGWSDAVLNYIREYEREGVEGT